LHDKILALQPEFHAAQKPGEAGAAFFRRFAAGVWQPRAIMVPSPRRLRVECKGCQGTGHLEGLRKNVQMKSGSSSCGRFFSLAFPQSSS